MAVNYLCAKCKKTRDAMGHTWSHGVRYPSFWRCEACVSNICDECHYATREYSGAGRGPFFHCPICNGGDEGLRRLPE